MASFRGSCFRAYNAQRVKAVMVWIFQGIEILAHGITETEADIGSISNAWLPVI